MGQLGVGGCSNWVARSTDGGANFTFQGFSASCPFLAAAPCFPDQPHLAADLFNTSPAGRDQVYAVSRLITPSGAVANCNQVQQNVGAETSVIACSNDNGVTWSLPLVLPGGGDHPRVAVGADGKVYAVTLNGYSILLTRFSSCALGFVPDPGFPITVVDGANVECPLPGLDRCNEALSSPMIAPDPLDPSHLFVTYALAAESAGTKFEWIIGRESRDSGLTLPGQFVLSPPTAARRFMPWSCSAKGTVFAGWYDRQAAVTGPTNDLTDYLLGSPIFAQSLSLSGPSDPQCASGWGGGPGATRSSNDSEACTVQPQLAGRCQNGAGRGSGFRVTSAPTTARFPARAARRVVAGRSMATTMESPARKTMSLPPGPPRRPQLDWHLYPVWPSFREWCPSCPKGRRAGTNSRSTSPPAKTTPAAHRRFSRAC
jgi:hypothetical protein